MIKPKALTSLSIFFPCYNEAVNVGTMIEQAVKAAASYGVDYEIVVVDDGSKDNSADIVRSWSAKNPHVRLARHVRNLGYGAALRTGFKNVSKDLVLLTDGDNQFQISDIEKLLAKIDSCDAVVGYRIDRRDKSYRCLNGFLWTQACRRLFGLKVRDVDCAFKLFRKKYLEGLELKSNHLLIHAEILARLKKRGARVEEIGVAHYPRTAGTATATRLGSVLKSVRELLSLYWQIR